MPERWCTVTVIDPAGRRHSVDVLASSTYDAAHLYVTHAKSNPETGIPPLSRETLFEIVIDGKIHHVLGGALQQWITGRRQEWKGPRGILFKQRATLD
jgi:hypothetical protein